MNKVHRHTKAPHGTFEVPEKCFMWSHIDLVEAVPLRDATAQKVTDAYLLHWGVKFGVPRHLISDRGMQFTSQVWEIMAKALGTKLHRTMAYHPQVNGLVERQHRKMKDALKSRLDGRPNWSQEPGISQESGRYCSKCELLLGRNWECHQRNSSSAPPSRYQATSSPPKTSNQQPAISLNVLGKSQQAEHPSALLHTAR